LGGAAKERDVLMANAHREQLANRHARIEANLAAELKRPVPDSALVRRLKAEKLKLKDEISSQLH
jgi:hypothetical protein